VDYGDIYYSLVDALGESSYVFLDGNHLPERFATLATPSFVIGELGFGAGLNFLNTCRLWCSTAPAAAQLHYVACERHPFTSADLQRLHALFPDLQLFSDRLQQRYPDHTTGAHQLALQFGEHVVWLTLLYGDALAQLQDYLARQQVSVDAWFLDGFSPKLNPALWQQELLSLVAQTATVTTTLSSYSVAGSFRRALTELGFTVNKRAGFTGKRHMLCASAPNLPASNSTEPRPVSTTQLGIARTRKVCIVGGGLAGCSTAWLLAQSGWQVELLEAGPTLATAGSGNLQGVLHCKPGTAASADNHFNLHAYLFAVRHYLHLQQLGFAWHECGMLHVGFNDEQRRRFQRIAACERYHPSVMSQVDANTASELAGIPLAFPALYFPQSGWLSPPTLCEFYCKHPNITIHTNSRAVELLNVADGWQIKTQQQSHFIADAVVLCNAIDLYDFAQCRALPLISNRGQVDVYASTAETTIKTILCGQGYLTPASNGLQSLGGSFYVEQTSNEQNRLTHLQLVGRMDKHVAENFAQRRPLQQRIGQRCQTPDRMPLVGALSAEFPGLYLNIGHGSNGLARTPISAALVASLLNNTPPPLPAMLGNLLAPTRFAK
jgi:tRNA 5-methylaminomethyl-2-thiouridine biosynthesis bifunctional protein